MSLTRRNWQKVLIVNQKQLIVLIKKKKVIRVKRIRKKMYENCKIIKDTDYTESTKIRN